MAWKLFLARARVTLITQSDYVRRGIRFGIEEWRSNNWQWERFGEMVPVKNLDLWRRIDRALVYHDVDLKRWRADAAHSLQSSRRSDTFLATEDKEHETANPTVERTREKKKRFSFTRASSSHDETETVESSYTEPEYEESQFEVNEQFAAQKFEQTDPSQLDSVFEAKN